MQKDKSWQSDFDNEAFIPPASGVLTLNLTALQHNYHLLQQNADGAHVAAVVKANAYGLGVKNIVPTLYQAGCRVFFVAQLAEAVAVQKVLAQTPLSTNLPCRDDRLAARQAFLDKQEGATKISIPDWTIAILNGLQQQEMAFAAKQGFLPVLNSLAEVEDWANMCQESAHKSPAILQIDSGMARLGLSSTELQALIAKPELLSYLDIKLILSHLACADNEKKRMNSQQEKRFCSSVHSLVQKLPQKPLLSLSASSGLVLGQQFCLDVVRPGLALYGIIEGQTKAAKLQHKMQPVVEISANVLRTADLDKGQTVGYGASFVAPHNMTTATISVGYADGWPRALSNQGAVYFQGVRLPIIGRISMDCMVVDTTALAGHFDIKRGDQVELIGPNQNVQMIAEQAGTIAYEILTAIGQRYQKNLR